MIAHDTLIHFAERYLTKVRLEFTRANVLLGHAALFAGDPVVSGGRWRAAQQLIDQIVEPFVELHVVNWKGPDREAYERDVRAVLSAQATLLAARPEALDVRIPLDANHPVIGWTFKLMDRLQKIHNGVETINSQSLSARDVELLQVSFAQVFYRFFDPAGTPVAYLAFDVDERTVPHARDGRFLDALVAVQLPPSARPPGAVVPDATRRAHAYVANQRRQLIAFLSRFPEQYRGKAISNEDLVMLFVETLLLAVGCMELLGLEIDPVALSAHVRQAYRNFRVVIRPLDGPLPPDAMEMNIADADLSLEKLRRHLAGIIASRPPVTPPPAPPDVPERPARVELPEPVLTVGEAAKLTGINRGTIHREKGKRIKVDANGMILLDSLRKYKAECDAKRASGEADLRIPADLEAAKAHIRTQGRITPK
jgi:hypothetical protein